MTAAPGWFLDPGTRAYLRWWDGAQWTPYTQAMPVAPPPPAPVAPPVQQPVGQAPPAFAKREGWWERQQAQGAESRQMQRELGISSWEAAKRQEAARKAARSGGVVAEMPPVTPSKEVAPRPPKPAKKVVEKAKPAKEVARRAAPARISSGVASPDMLRVVRRWPLEEQIEVAGETYYMKAIKTVFKQAGTPITARGVTLDHVPTFLCPEPSNSHDRNAVMVMVGIHMVGYLPADIAVEYARPLLKLARMGEAVGCESRIWACLEGGMARARVTVLAPEAEELP